MAIKIKVGDAAEQPAKKIEPITMELNARKSLDGHIMIFDHKDIDIVVRPENKQIITFPKDEMHDDVYDSQDRLFDYLGRKGVIKRESVESGDVYASIQANYPEAVEGTNTTQMVVFSVAKWLNEEKPAMEMEEYYENEVEDWFLDPDDEESTELGEVPHKEKKGAIDPGRVRKYLTGYGLY